MGVGFVPGLRDRVGRLNRRKARELCDTRSKLNAWLLEYRRVSNEVERGDAGSRRVRRLLRDRDSAVVEVVELAGDLLRETAIAPEFRAEPAPVSVVVEAAPEPPGVCPVDASAPLSDEQILLVLNVHYRQVLSSAEGRRMWGRLLREARAVALVESLGG